MINEPESIEKFIPLILVGVFLSLFILELLFQLRQRKRPIIPRLMTNFIVAGLAYLIGSLVLKPLAVHMIGWTSDHSFGLLNILSIPYVLQFAIGFLLMDLSFYYWHRANHVVPILWRFHNVHHIDPDLDVSTSFRFHFVEILYSTVFRAIQISLIGVSLSTYVVYELVFQMATMFHHSNLKLPVETERLLNKVIVTPRMHGVHHSAVQDETDSNYSVIFRWWDAIHRTLRLGIPQSEIDIGVAAYQNPGDNGLLNIFTMPFIKQRDYWILPDGSVAKRNGVSAKNALKMLG